MKKIICFFILSLNIVTTAIAQVPVIGSIGFAIGKITNQKNNKNSKEKLISNDQLHIKVINKKLNI